MKFLLEDEERLPGEVDLFTYQSELDAEELYNKIKNKEVLEDWFEVLVPKSGNADTLAGELVRAMMRILYRDHNDGDRFFSGYGVETCGGSAQFIIENTNEAIANDLTQIAEDNLDDSEYSDAIEEVSKELLNYLNSNKEILGIENDEDSREWELAEDLIPKYDFDCELPPQLYGIIRYTDYSEEDLEGEIYYWEADGGQIGNEANRISVDGYMLYIEGIEEDMYNDLNRHMYKWLEDFADELAEEYPIDEEDEGEDGNEDFDESLHNDEIEQHRKATKEIGLKTLGDLKTFKDHQGSAELNALKDYKKELDLDEALGLKEGYASWLCKYWPDDKEDRAQLDRKLRYLNLKKELVDEDAIIKGNKENIQKFMTWLGLTANRFSEIKEESLKEDTIKQNGKWVNKGKEGTHGTFKTKKEADAQRKAMFARGFKESIQKNEISDFFDKARRLGVETLGQLKDLLNQEESKSNTEKEKIDAYADAVELGDDTLSNESLKEDLNKESLEQEIRKAIREHFRTWDDEDYEDMIGEYLVVEVEDQEDGRTKVEVRAELTYNTMDKIADELNKIVQKYDKDAYFDHEDAGIINAFIDKNAEGKVIDEYDASKDEKLQGIRLRDYRNKWSAIDHMKVNGVDYYMFENDTYGDETYYVVTPNINEGPFYETFDDIETCLRDEGVLEESLNESNSEEVIVTVTTDTMSINDIQEYLGNYAKVDGRGNYIYIKVKPEKLDLLKSELRDLDLEFEDGELDEKLIQGKSDATLKKNIATEVKAGKDPKQAYAIAKSIQDKHKNEELEEQLEKEKCPEKKDELEGEIEKIESEIDYADDHNNPSKVISLQQDLEMLKENDEADYFNGDDAINEEPVAEIELDIYADDTWEDPYIVSEPFKPEEEIEDVKELEVIPDDLEDVEELQAISNKVVEDLNKQEQNNNIAENKEKTIQAIENILDEEDAVIDYTNPNILQEAVESKDVDLNKLKG